MSKEANDILTLEQRRLDASVAVDLPTLNAIYDDTLVYVHSSGRIDNKSAVLEQLSKNRHIVKLERSDLNTQVWNDTALLWGPINYLFRRPDGTHIAMSAIATQTFKRYPDGWRVVAFQATQIKPPEVAPVK